MVEKCNRDVTTANRANDVKWIGMKLIQIVGDLAYNRLSGSSDSSATAIPCLARFSLLSLDDADML